MVIYKCFNIKVLIICVNCIKEIFIVIKATCLTYVYGLLGGQDVVGHLITEKTGLGPSGMQILVMMIVFSLGFSLIS